ncbi:MAG: oxygen-independent coproporphyrinogen III oxidase [Alphaproteobacteria bacterium]
MEQDLLARYGGAAPRYTSYPTAPHFCDSIGTSAYRDALSQLSVEEPVSLYLHIPYCDTLCWFCGCHTKITRQYRPVRDYVDSLVQELLLIAETAPPGLRMSHMHWGGGSPTLLREKDILRLARAAIALFRPLGGFEFAVEIDPRDAGVGRIASLVTAGLTRASIGVQDFDPQVQRSINRVQSFAETARVVDSLRERGVQNLNLDLMYGLPYQSKARTLATVQRALDLDPDRIALFGYAHVPWMKPHQRLIPEDALPGPEERLEAFDAASDLLVRAGYMKIGIDHFAKPTDSMAKAQAAGKLRRNFQGYTTDTAASLIGAGASAISHLPNLYLQNTAQLHRYSDRVRQGELPIDKGVRLTADDRLRAAIIERLMCDFSVDLSKLCTIHGTAPTDIADALARLEPMVSDGLLTIEVGKIEIQPTGKSYIRQIAACFDKYFNNGPGAHSQVI